MGNNLNATPAVTAMGRLVGNVAVSGGHVEDQMENHQRNLGSHANLPSFPGQDEVDFRLNTSNSKIHFNGKVMYKLYILCPSRSMHAAYN